MIYKASGKQKVNPLEPSCNKPAYNSQADALDMIKHIEETRVSKKIRTYQCPVCGLWHLTSKGKP
jgi:hypothetical protein